MTFSFLNKIGTNDGQLNLTSITIDDLALLNQNSETHREVDSKLHAFDDLQLLNRNNSKKDHRADQVDRFTGSRHDSMYKNTLIDRMDFEENKEEKKRRVTGIYKTNEFLAPNRHENRFEDLGRARDNSGQYRSTSFSLKSGKKKKTQELTRLYEFEPEDDQDPYYEVYDCKRMTFLESVLNKPIYNFTRVETKHTDYFGQFKKSESKQDDPEEELKRSYKRQYNEVEKTLRPVYFDDEEAKLYKSYFAAIPTVIDKHAEYDKRIKQADCDVNALTANFYSFITPLYRDKDYRKVDERERHRNEDIKHDAEVVKKYLNYASIHALNTPAKMSV